ncbi:MAG: hypothetical protein FJX18_02185 [Alphaproteobacteria bacterium]|nr:hypothetical protein [Alphaproteobacteria bacterium]
MKKFIYFLTTTCFLPVASYAAEVDSRPDLDRFGVGRYNALKTVMEAESIVKGHSDFDDFLEESRKTVESYGQQENIGYRLLHRHGNLHDDHKMIESFGVLDGDVAIITQETTGASSVPYAPASWFVQDDQVFSFEFSTDPLVLKVKEYLQTVPLLQNLHELMASYDLQSALAPAILSRAQYEPFKPRFAEGYEWVEQTIATDDDLFRNVLTLKHLSEEEKESYVKTSYAFVSLSGNCPISWCDPTQVPHEPLSAPKHLWR